MAEAEKEETLAELRLRSPLIHEMKYDIMAELCKILDEGEMWIELAPFMPDISPTVIEACKRDYVMGNSPSKFLLRVWASKGYCIVDLYNLFAITRLVRCMQIMRNEVHPRFHYLENYVAPQASAGAPRPRPHIITSVTRGQQSVCATAGTPFTARSTRPAATPVATTTTSTAAASHQPHSAQTGAPKDDSSLFSGLKNTPTVSYAELLQATDNFNNGNIIGKGGYGVVYRGEWKQTQVAVKRLSSASSERSHRLEKERLRQSLQELNTLSMYRHDNILPVYGYSLDGPEPCLVYQFMANGSLDDRLQCKKGSLPLSWLQKAVIARGSAKALHFLHTISRAPLIHGDVKTANILLDRHLEPKLGDFGLSREGQAEMDVEEKSVLIASHIKGTLAYLPPEFINSKILTTKLDVYSFGVVLLEVATGQRAYLDSRKPPSIVEHCSGIAAANAKNPNPSQLFTSNSDKRTPSSGKPERDEKVFTRIWKIGIECCKSDRHVRPSFKEIVGGMKDIDQGENSLTEAE